MPSLSKYKQELDYSYAPGFFPAMECLQNRPSCVRRVLLHSKAAGTEGAEKLTALADKLHVRVEEADRVLAGVSGKENCFAAAVFGKFNDTLDRTRPHVVLHHPADCGNLGTIMRTCLGFGVEDIAIITPGVDVFDPRSVRASMGSLFSMRVHVYPDFEMYRNDYPGHALYPFMLNSATSLPVLLADELPLYWTLVFGNEGTGLPPEFAEMGRSVRIPSSSRIDSLNLSVAAAIGIYSFTQKMGLSAAHPAL